MIYDILFSAGNNLSLSSVNSSDSWSEQGSDTSTSAGPQT